MPLIGKATGFNARSSIQHSSSPGKETKCSKIFQRQPDFRSPHRSRHEGPEARVDVWGDAAGTAPAVTSTSRLGLRFISQIPCNNAPFRRPLYFRPSSHALTEPALESFLPRFPIIQKFVQLVRKNLSRLCSVEYSGYSCSAFYFFGERRIA